MKCLSSLINFQSINRKGRATWIKTIWKGWKWARKARWAAILRRREALPLKKLRSTLQEISWTRIHSRDLVMEKWEAISMRAGRKHKSFTVRTRNYLAALLEFGLTTCSRIPKCREECWCKAEWPVPKRILWLNEAPSKRKFPITQKPLNSKAILIEIASRKTTRNK